MNHSWEKKRLGDVCEIRTGKLDANAKEENGMYPFFTCDATPYKINEFAFDDEAILISGNGSNVGHVHYYNGKFNAYQRTYVLTHFAHFFPPYIVVYMKGYLRPYIFQSKKGGCIPFITLPILTNFSIPCPSNVRQIEIVAEFDRLNELIEIKRSQLKDLDALAQSLFYEIFGDPLENSKKWNVGTLSEYANFKNGLNFTPADDGNKIKCLGVGDFKSNRYIKAENLPEINIVEAVSEEYLLKDGDIILVRSNGNKALIGRSIMYVSDNSLATFSGFCIRCRYNREKLAPLFLSYYLSCGAIREYITSQGRGCNISNLNQKILSGIPLILPPLSLQNEFAKKIEVIEEQKRLIESSIADLETLLASRMDYWFND